MFRSKVQMLILQKALAEKRKITNAEIAEAIGVQDSTVSQWVRGELMGQVKAHVVAGFCDYFDCSLDDLLEVVSDETPEIKTPLLGQFGMVKQEVGQALVPSN